MVLNITDGIYVDLNLNSVSSMSTTRRDVFFRLCDRLCDVCIGGGADILQVPLTSCLCLGILVGNLLGAK